MILWITLVLMLTLYLGVGHLGNIAAGQQQSSTNTSSIPLPSNDDVTNEILNDLQKLIEQNERLIQQKIDSSESAVIGSYLGMLAFLTGLALVIFGLQMSRGDKITATSRLYYRVLILVLILPVIGLIIWASINRANPDYLGVATLLLIPAVAVLVLSQHRKLLDKL